MTKKKEPPIQFNKVTATGWVLISKLAESRKESQATAMKTADMILTLMAPSGTINSRILRGLVMLLREGHTLELIPGKPKSFMCSGVEMDLKHLKDGDPNERWKAVKGIYEEIIEGHEFKIPGGTANTVKSAVGPGVHIGGMEINPAVKYFSKKPAKEWTIGQRVQIVNRYVIKNYNPLGLPGIVHKKEKDGQYLIRVEHIGTFKVEAGDLEER